MRHRSRGRGKPAAERLETELRSLERQVREASPGYETQFLNRAGDLCIESGQAERALGYFGRAIDAYLESGRFSAAEVVCRKLLRIAPHAVRARCTLAWLAIGKGYQSATEDELAAYVQASVRADREGLAATQLRMMAEAATSAGLREQIAAYLLELGDLEGADRVYGEIHAERNGLRPPPVTDEGKMWARLLRAALMGPEELSNRGTSGPTDESTDDSNDLLPGLISRSTGPDH